MRRLFLSLLILAFALPAIAQSKHPFTFDDMMKLKRVGDPQVSPDGKWVIFSVVDVDLDGQHQDAAHLDRAYGRRPRERNHCRSGRRPSALGSRWQALRVSLDERKRIAGLDCGIRCRRGNVPRLHRSHFNADRGQWRTLVPRRQEHTLYFRRLSRTATIDAAQAEKCNATRKTEGSARSRR